MQAFGMSEAARATLWARYREGYPHRAISPLIGCSSASVWYVVRARGGVAPLARRRASRTLSRVDREEISRGLACDESFAVIAARLARPTSTVSREVQPHGGRRRYRAETADARAWRWAQRPKVCRLATRPR